MKITRNDLGRYDVKGLEDSFKKNKKDLKGIAAYSKIWGAIAACFGFALKCKDESGSTIYLIKSSALKYLNRHGEKVSKEDNKKILQVLENLSPQKTDPLPKTKTDPLPKAQLAEKVLPLFEEAVALLKNDNKQDNAKAVEMLKKVADQGLEQAIDIVVDIYINGKLGVKQNLETVFKYLDKLKDKNKIIDFLINTANTLSTDNENNVTALELLKKAANLGSDEAVDKVAKIYLIGMKDVEPNKAKAEEWLNKSKDKAETLLDVARESIKKETPEGNVKGVELLKKASEQGSDRARHDLVRIYLRGMEGIPSNEASAKEWLSKIKTKDEHTLFVFAKYYFDAKRYAESAQFFMECNQFANAGKIYLKFLKQPDNAFKALSKAAEAGDSYSMFQLSKLYEKGEGVLKDETKAKEWFEKSAPWPSRSRDLDFIIKRYDPFACIEMHKLMVAQGQREKAAKYYYAAHDNVTTKLAFIRVGEAFDGRNNLHGYEEAELTALHEFRQLLI